MRNIQYDRNGNMTGNLTTDMGFNKVQAFSHTGNRLTALTESFPMSSRPTTNSSFAYDLRGNMTSDSRNGLRISYNILNLPSKVEKTDSTDMASFRYLYDGTKVAAVRSDGTSIRYQGSFVIECSTTGFPSTIKSIAWADGVCAAKDGGSGYGDYLYVKDHLGNVRDIVALYKADTTPVVNAIVSKSDYLPFGERISARPM